MRQNRSFFEREAAFILLLELAIPTVSLIIVLIMLLYRWLSR